jgi:hypothetical protein
MHDNYETILRLSLLGENDKKMNKSLFIKYGQNIIE